MFGNFLQSVFAQVSLGDGTSTVTGFDAALQGLKSLGIMAGAVLLPFILSRFASKQLKMPTHNVAFYWIILATLSTAFILATGTLKYGPEIDPLRSRDKAKRSLQEISKFRFRFVSTHRVPRKS